MRDNMKEKELKGRFIQKGTVVSKCGKSAVIIKKENGKIEKKNLRDVKRVII